MNYDNMAARKSPYTSEQLVKFYKLWSSDVSGDVIAWQTTIPEASQKFIGNAMSVYLENGIISAHASLEMRDAIARIEFERAKGGDKNMNTTNGITSRTFTKQGEPLKTNLNERTPVIYKTYDYSKFKFLPENRPINPYKVEKIARSIMEDDQTPFRPILVDANFGIIDGQHQFKAEEKLELPVYYVQNKEAQLRSIALLNAYTTSWSLSNFAYFYAKQGKTQYQHVLDFATKSHLTISLAIMMLTMQFHNMGTQRSEFKNGLFAITHEKEANILLDEVQKMRSMLQDGLEKDREFYRAYMIMRNQIDFSVFLDTLTKKRLEVNRQANKRDYLREFERILNYEKSTKLVRLF